MEKISYKLEVFEGPMDLLLHLITKHKLDIYDIPIVELVDQYTAYVRAMQDEDMDVASEFLEMAARLVYIKTVSLLPVYEDAEEQKNLLTQELIEYQECKLLAQKLACMTTGFDYVVRAVPEDVEPDLTYKRLHEPSELLKAYAAVVGKKLRKLPPPLDSFKTIVAKKIVAVSTKIVFVIRNLLKGERVKLSGLYKTAQSRSEMVATFLAVLELCKANRVKIDGNGENQEISLVKGHKNR